MKLVVVMLLCIGMVGCGGPANAPTLAKVSGVANFQGKPLADATVTFYPAKGPVGIGRTDADGKFQMRTNGSLGVVVDTHKVTVFVTDEAAEPPPMDGNEMAIANKSVLPKKYSDKETTDLQITVPAEGNANLVLDLTE
jgi:hypothetical protein